MEHVEDMDEVAMVAAAAAAAVERDYDAGIASPQTATADGPAPHHEHHFDARPHHQRVRSEAAPVGRVPNNSRDLDPRSKFAKSRSFPPPPPPVTRMALSHAAAARRHEGATAAAGHAAAAAAPAAGSGHDPAAGPDSGAGGRARDGTDREGPVPLLHSRSLDDELDGDRPGLAGPRENLSRTFSGTGIPSPHICTNCEKRQPIVYCDKCEEYLCGSCDEFLHMSSRKRRHVRVPAGAAVLEPLDDDDGDEVDPREALAKALASEPADAGRHGGDDLAAVAAAAAAESTPKSGGGGGGDSSDAGDTADGDGDDLAFHGHKTLIERTQVDVRSFVGEGFFGKVYSGVWRGQKVALKRLKSETAARGESLDAFRKEVAVLCQLSHPNVLHFFGITTPPDVLIVSEFMSGGSLHDLLHKRRDLRLALALTLRLARDVACGVAYLHNLPHPIVHRDITSSNVLLSSNAATLPALVDTNVAMAKVADFGLSRTVDWNMTQGAGNMFYLAPEVFRGDRYTESADTFSYGVLLWELLARERPYKGLNAQSAAFKVAVEGLRPTLDAIDARVALYAAAGGPAAHTTARALMQQCWAEDPSTRPRMSDVAGILMPNPAPTPAGRGDGDHRVFTFDGAGASESGGGASSSSMTPRYAQFLTPKPARGSPPKPGGGGASASGAAFGAGVAAEAAARAAVGSLGIGGRDFTTPGGHVYAMPRSLPRKRSDPIQLSAPPQHARPTPAKGDRGGVGGDVTSDSAGGGGSSHTETDTWGDTSGADESSIGGGASVSGASVPSVPASDGPGLVRASSSTTSAPATSRPSTGPQGRGRGAGVGRGGRTDRRWGGGGAAAAGAATSGPIGAPPDGVPLMARSMSDGAAAGAPERADGTVWGQAFAEGFAHAESDSSASRASGSRDADAAGTDVSASDDAAVVAPEVTPAMARRPSTKAMLQYLEAKKQSRSSRSLLDVDDDGDGDEDDDDPEGMATLMADATENARRVAAAAKSAEASRRGARGHTRDAATAAASPSPPRRTAMRQRSSSISSISITGDEVEDVIERSSLVLELPGVDDGWGDEAGDGEGTRERKGGMPKARVTFYGAGPFYIGSPAGFAADADAEARATGFAEGKASEAAGKAADGAQGATLGDRERGGRTPPWRRAPRENLYVVRHPAAAEPLSKLAPHITIRASPLAAGRTTRLHPFDYTLSFATSSTYSLYPAMDPSHLNPLVGDEFAFARRRRGAGMLAKDEEHPLMSGDAFELGDFSMRVLELNVAPLEGEDDRAPGDASARAAARALPQKDSSPGLI